MKQPFLKEPIPITQVLPKFLWLHAFLITWREIFIILYTITESQPELYDIWLLFSFFPLIDLAVLGWELVFHARKACALLLSLTLNSHTCCCTGGLVCKQLDLRLLFCLCTCVCEPVLLLYTWGSQKTIWGVWSLLLSVLWVSLGSKGLYLANLNDPYLRFS